MDASTLKFRLVLLFFISAATTGSYYSYDLPGGLPAPAQLYIGKNTTAGYGLLYSVYSYPNVFLPFLGGWLIDNVFGLRASTVVTAALVLAGNALVAAAATIKDDQGAAFVPFCLAVVGRFIFGAGGETLTVAQSNLLVRWYPLAERATAFALVLAFSRLGGALNIMLEKPLYEHFSKEEHDDHLGFAIVCWTSVAICAFSLMCAIAIAACDLMGERQGVVAKEHENQPENNEKRLEEHLLEEDPNSAEDESTTTWVDRIADIRHVLGIRELFIYVAGVAFYLGVLTFVSYGKKYFDHKWAACADHSSTFLSLPYYIAAGASPVFGLMIDRAGRALLWVAIASFSLLGMHIFLQLSPGNDSCAAPLASMIWLGFTYSLCAASIWPMLALIVDAKRLGTGYGIMTAIQNLGFAFYPSIVGNLLDSSSPQKYATMEWMFIGLSAAAAALSAGLICIDGSMGGTLMASAKRLKRESEKEESESFSAEPPARTVSTEAFRATRERSFER